MTQVVSNRFIRFLKMDRDDIIGFIMMFAPFVIGAINKQSMQIASTLPKHLTACDTRIHGLCIPTFYIPIPVMGQFFIINFTSTGCMIALFVVGFILVERRKRKRQQLNNSQFSKWSEFSTEELDVLAWSMECMSGKYRPWITNSLLNEVKNEISRRGKSEKIG